MAIDNNFFKTLVKTLKFIDKPARVACLGYPDLLVSEDLLKKEVYDIKYKLINREKDLKNA